MPSTHDHRTAEQRTLEALEQSAFERDRMIAWYAAELHNLRWQHGRDRVLLEARDREVADLQAVVRALQDREREILGSTSWRVTLPLRAVRSPRRYVARLMRR